MTLKLDKQLELHRMMMLIRLFEEALEEMFSRGLLHGTMHLSIGQEASAAGACLALDKEDLITSTHRGHGHCLGKGADLQNVCRATRERRWLLQRSRRINAYC